ncbi:aminotransferase class III-fold pyridoxal phosphate-dependent enzyme [Nocardia arthritidis]|uniref:Aminotransferase class III-fold pyridoxal phosphate-dependent enzyme n=1 Tax=Nocardia arthritidis TaxID=228602 RepID=A0A6G9Y929_9NOCA|nr:aminotransferase class III-fold pyridoxal phosphate-dependent enzyme [Nocardia arthritidis]QIS09577.1 aminotransferase class III-fold pyridoxal phosphate-dependent enzyme [Nocardia arthritidis]
MSNDSRKLSDALTKPGLAAVEAGRLLWWTGFYGARYALSGARKKGETGQVTAAKLLRGYLLNMGPLYIKAGQVLGTQTGLLPRDATEEFRSFFSNLPPMSRKDLEETLRTQLRAPVNQLFAHFDWQPVAVGSVAQVHRAVLKSGETVAIKVVKRGVAERLQASATVLGALLNTAHALIPAVRKLDGPANFNELRPFVTGQCDMRAEAKRQRAIAENFSSHPYLRVPRVLEEFSTDRVLVMEYIDGISGEDVDLISPELRPDLARRMQDAFDTMAYFHGLFHVDPHPGNVMFREGGEIVLLDFGLVGELNEDDKWALAGFYFACTREEWDKAVLRFTNAFLEERGDLDKHWDAYAEDMAGILRLYFLEQTDKWSTMSFFDDAIALLNKYGARPTTRFTLLSLAFLTGEGFVSVVDPQIDIWANARRFNDRYSPYMSEDLAARFEEEIGSMSPASIAIKDNPERALIAPTHLDRYVFPSQFPMIIEEAKGSKVRDIDGNEYIDLSCGYGPHILGYAPEVAVEAIQKAAAKGAVNAMGNRGELDLAELISDAFDPLTNVILCNSGTESVQVALRLARAHTRRDRIAKFEGHYHGFTDQGTVSSWFVFSGEKYKPRPINSAGAQRAVTDRTVLLQYGHPSAFETIAKHADELAAVIIEPMPGATLEYDAVFLQQLRDVCTANGIVLIYDEVVTGFRVHFGGAQHLAGVRPDLTCLGKIIGGGLPCGAVVGRPEVMERGRTTGDPFTDIDERAFVGGTMSGNSITTAAGLAVLEYLGGHTEIYAELDANTRRLIADLKATTDERGIACKIKGSHSMFNIAFDYASPKLVRDKIAGTNIKASIALAYYMRPHGVYFPELHGLFLNAAHTSADLDHIAEAFAKCVGEMEEHGLFLA